jgi:hypothetical protein
MDSQGKGLGDRTHSLENNTEVETYAVAFC